MGKGPGGLRNFAKAVYETNKQIALIVPKASAKRITPTEGYEAYIRYKGRCAYCGIPLSIREFKGKNSLHFEFYIPLAVTKQVILDHLIPVCIDHQERYRFSRGLREDIPDVNTFADLIEVMIRAVLLENKYAEERHPDLAPTREKIRRIKRLLNMQLEDLTTTMKYLPFKDWTPESYQVFSDVESIPDIVDQMTIQAKEEKQPDKEKLTNAIKQVLVTKKYRVVRE